MMSINQATTGTQLYCKTEEVLNVQNQMFTIALLLMSDTLPGIGSLNPDVGRTFWDLPRSRQHMVSTEHSVHYYNNAI